MSCNHTYDELHEKYHTLNNTFQATKIDGWFDDRGITENGKPLAQAIKTLEETTELLDAIQKNDKYEMMDAVGDIYVTLRGVCLTAGFEFGECVNQAYDEIKDRKGYLTPEGTFVKEV
jgi:NTP pyrophosphatase (non-canonical NTP hydrolase)